MIIAPIRSVCSHEDESCQPCVVRELSETKRSISQLTNQSHGACFGCFRLVEERAISGIDTIGIKVDNSAGFTHPVHGGEQRYQISVTRKAGWMHGNQ